jgi:hypothetical protein
MCAHDRKEAEYGYGILRSNDPGRAQSRRTRKHSLNDPHMEAAGRDFAVLRVREKRCLVLEYEKNPSFCAKAVESTSSAPAVIPAKAGIPALRRIKIPAFAGMTIGFAKK